MSSFLYMTIDKKESPELLVAGNRGLVRNVRPSMASSTIVPSPLG